MDAAARATEELEGATQALPQPDPLGGVDHGIASGMRAEWKMLQAQINALLVHGHTVAQQMAELSQRVGKVESRQQQDDARIAQLLTDVGSIQLEVSEISKITVQIRDLITAGKVAKNIGDGAGWFAGVVTKIAVGAAAVLATVAAWTHISKP